MTTHCYAANGDGAGFGSEFSDIVMNRITGSPASGDISGEGLAPGDDLGQVWSGDEFTRIRLGALLRLSDDAPTWTDDRAAKEPVLVDERRRHPSRGCRGRSSSPRTSGLIRGPASGSAA